jgi:hypothetical protein
MKSRLPGLAAAAHPMAALHPKSSQHATYPNHPVMLLHWQ